MMVNRDSRSEMMLGGLLANHALFVEVVGRFEGRVFSREEYDSVFGLMRRYYKEFNRIPTAIDLSMLADRIDLDRLPPFGEFLADPEISAEVLRHSFYSLYQRSTVLQFVEDIEGRIEQKKMDVKEVFAAMKDVVVKSSEPDRTYIELSSKNIVAEYWGARDWRTEGASPLIFKGISKLAAGGISKRELLIFVAPPNRGKTTYLINEFYQGLLNGERVLMLSMENEKESIISRLADRILLMPRFEQRFSSDLCERWVERFFRCVPEPVIMYKAAGTYSVSDLDLWLEEYELKYGKRFDRVIVDYIDKFKKPKSGKSSDEWEDPMRRLSDDLRAVAIARDLRIITAAQTNRSGIVNREGTQTETVHEGMIGGAFSKFETADIVLAYSETPGEKQRGTGRVGVLKMRESGGRGREFVVTMAPWLGLITDTPNDLLPPDKQKLFDSPDRGFGELKGLAVKSPEVKKPAGPRKGGVPRVADLSGGGDKGIVKSEGVNI